MSYWYKVKLKIINLYFSVKNRREQVYTPQFNHISMKMPSVPLLSQRDSISSDMFCDHKSLTNCTDNVQCECTNVIKIPLGDVVELILIDEGNFPFLNYYRYILFYFYFCIFKLNFNL